MEEESELKQAGVSGPLPVVGAPQLMGYSVLQAEPLLSWKGFPWRKEEPSSWRKLVLLAPGSRLLCVLDHGSVTAWAGKKRRRQ